MHANFNVVIMICFLCSKNYESITVLIQHLKRVHDLKQDSLIRCCGENCNQIFRNFGSFKKHCNRKHNNDLLVDSTIDFNNAISNESINNVVKPQKSTENNTDNNVCHILYNKLSSSVENNCPNQNEHGKSEQRGSSEIDITLDDLFQQYSHAATSFVFSLHDNDNFSRKDVITIQKSIESMLINPLLDLLNSFAVYKIKHDSVAKNELSGLISKCRNPFLKLNSDYLLWKWLYSGDYGENVTEFTIENQVVACHRKGSLVYDEKTITGVIMPLKFQFRKTFESNNMLSRTLEYLQLLKNETKFISFMQGHLWQRKILMYPDKTILPFFLYIDDFEINNPLGTHSGTDSVCNLYYTFPCIPDKSSKLEGIFFAGSIKSSNVKSYGNEKCFEFLVEQFKELEINGIEIQSTENTDAKMQVHFLLALVLGDNLGLNGFLDFSKAFTGPCFCRICKAKRDACQTLANEREDLIRTKLNYESDIRLNNTSETGIVCDSILNSIPSFHVVENPYIDLMHDVFEGVCHYDLCHAISHFIKMKYFDLFTLNSRKSTFEYGRHEIGNASGPITQKHLDNKKLKMSAREMMTFVLYFPLMVGDLIPDDDEVWRFVINFVEIIDILLSFEVHESNLTLLKIKIQNHHADYVRLFRDTLKPKFHNLTHAVRVLRESGPLRKLWCFNYETKHRAFKIYSHCITSRKNICLSLAKKYQLKFANYLIQSKSDKERDFSISYDAKHEIKSNYLNVIKCFLKVEPQVDVKTYSHIEYLGHEFKPTVDYIVTFDQEIDIFKIVEICVVENEKVFFFAQKQQVEYNSHFIAYDVNVTCLGQLNIIPVHNILGPPVSLIKTAGGRSMIRIKDYYKAIA